MEFIHKQHYWVSHVLQDRDVERRLTTCELLQRQNRKSFLRRIITGGKK